MSESMGSVTQICFIPVTNVDIFNAVGRYAYLRLREDGLTLPAALKKSELSAEPSDEDSGYYHEHKAVIYIPQGNVDDNLLSLVDENYFLYGLIKYKIFNGTEYVLGSKSLPLKLSLSESHPEEAADFNGYVLTLSSKLPHKQLLVKTI